MIWKNQTCEKCINKTEAPRPPGIPQLNAPKIYMCRAEPPQISYAVGERAGRPFPIPLTSFYPIVADDFPACSKYNVLDLD